MLPNHSQSRWVNSHIPNRASVGCLGPTPGGSREMRWQWSHWLGEHWHSPGSTRCWCLGPLNSLATLSAFKITNPEIFSNNQPSPNWGLCQEDEYKSCRLHFYSAFHNRIQDGIPGGFSVCSPSRHWATPNLLCARKMVFHIPSDQALRLLWQMRLLGRSSAFPHHSWIVVKKKNVPGPAQDSPSMNPSPAWHFGTPKAAPCQSLLLLHLFPFPRPQKSRVKEEECRRGEWWARESEMI